MEKITISPTKYHQIKFNKDALPDLEKTGPVSASLLSRLKDPYLYLISGEKKPTKDMEWGSLIDCLILTPEQFGKEYIELPNDAPPDLRRFKDSKKPSADTLAAISWWNTFEHRALNRKVVSKDTMDEARRAVTMVKIHKKASEIIESSEKQVAFMGENPLISPYLGSRYPGTFKGMIDLLPIKGGKYGDCVVDFKETNNISDHALKNTIHAFEYHMKMAVYIELVNALEGSESRNRAILIFQESSFPFRVRIVELHKRDLNRGLNIAISRMEILMEASMDNLNKYIDDEVRVLELYDWMSE